MGLKMSTQHFSICMLKTKDNWVENNTTFNTTVPLSGTFFQKMKRYQPSRIT